MQLMFSSVCWEQVMGMITQVVIVLELLQQKKKTT